MLRTLQGVPPAPEAARLPFTSPARRRRRKARAPEASAAQPAPRTLGSRVPECPVFSTRRMRLIQATTSWDDGLEGLSRLMTP